MFFFDVNPVSHLSEGRIQVCCINAIVSRISYQICTIVIRNAMRHKTICNEREMHPG